MQLTEAAANALLCGFLLAACGDMPTVFCLTHLNSVLGLDGPGVEWMLTRAKSKHHERALTFLALSLPRLYGLLLDRCHGRGLCASRWEPLLLGLPAGAAPPLAYLQLLSSLRPPLLCASRQLGGTCCCPTAAV